MSRTAIAAAAAARAAFNLQTVLVFATWSCSGVSLCSSEIALALLVAQAPALVAVALRVVCSSVADAERNAAEAQRVTAGESCGLFFLGKGCS